MPKWITNVMPNLFYKIIKMTIYMCLAKLSEIEKKYLVK